MIDIAKIDEPKQSGDQNTLISGDGKVGVASQCIAQHGTAYHPKKGALAVSLAVAGNSGNSAIIPLEASKRVQLKEGESAFGNFESGAYMVFRADGSIECFGEFKHTGNMTINGNLTVSGTIQSQAVQSSTASIGGKDFGTHRHPETGTNTGAPI